MDTPQLRLNAELGVVNCNPAAAALLAWHPALNIIAGGLRPRRSDELTAVWQMAERMAGWMDGWQGRGHTALLQESNNNAVDAARG